MPVLSLRDNELLGSITILYVLGRILYSLINFIRGGYLERMRAVLLQRYREYLAPKWQIALSENKLYNCVVFSESVYASKCQPGPESELEIDASNWWQRVSYISGASRLARSDISFSGENKYVVPTPSIKDYIHDWRCAVLAGEMSAEAYAENTTPDPRQSTPNSAPNGDSAQDYVPRITGGAAAQSSLRELQIEEMCKELMEQDKENPAGAQSSLYVDAVQRFLQRHYC